MVVKNYRALCALLEVEVKEGNSRKSQLKDMGRYFKYHKEGNKFIIDKIYCEVKEKEDGRKNNGHNPNSHNNKKGTSKYGDVVIPTILYLLKETEDHEIIDYSSRILEKIGAVSYEFIRFEAEDSYSNNFYASIKNDIKKSFLVSPCNSAQTLGYIKYDNEYIECQKEENGIWIPVKKEEDKKIFKRYSNEVLKLLGCEDFEDLTKKSFKDRSIKRRFNGMLLEKLHKDERLQWYNYRWYTRITLVDSKGNDMDTRKEVNDKVLEFVENRIEGHKEKNNEKEDRNGLNKKKPKKFNIEKEEKVMQLIENKSLESVDPKEYKANKKRKAYEKIREEDRDAKFKEEIEVAKKTTREARRNATSLQIKRSKSVEEDYYPFKEVDERCKNDDDDEDVLFD